MEAERQPLGLRGSRIIQVLAINVVSRFQKACLEYHEGELQGRHVEEPRDIILDARNRWETPVQLLTPLQLLRVIALVELWVPREIQVPELRCLRRRRRRLWRGGLARRRRLLLRPLFLVIGHDILRALEAVECAAERGHRCGYWRPQLLPRFRFRLQLARISGLGSST